MMSACTPKCSIANQRPFEIATDLQPEDLDVGDGRRARLDPGAQIRDLRTAIEAAPKSTKWKLRARVGEKKTWYQEPEEVGHGVAPGVQG